MPQGSDAALGTPNDFTCSAEVNSACAKGLPAADRLGAPKGAACVAALSPNRFEKTRCNIMGKRIVIALGGNALGDNLPEQMIAVKQTAKAIADLI